MQLLCNEIKPEQRITQGRAAPAAQQALPQHQHMLPGPPEQHTGRASTVTWPMPCPACAPASASSQNQLGATCWPSQAVRSPKMGQVEVSFLSGHLVPWAIEHFFPSSPSLPHRVEADQSLPL